MTDDRSTEELERDAERIRDGIANTAEELKHRMSPGQMVDEVSRYFRDSDSSVAVENLRRQVRDNPMALALIGAGFAWLMLGGRRGHSAGDDGYNDDIAHGEVRGAFGAEGYRPGAAGSSGGNGSYGDRARDAAGRVRGAAHDYADRARSAAHDYGDRARDAGHSYGDQARDASGRASGYAEGVADRLRTASHDARDKVAELGQAAGETLRGATAGVTSRLHGASDAGSRWAGEAGERGRHWADEARHYAERGRGTVSSLEREPLVTGAIGLAIGAFLALVLPRMRSEEEAYREAREQMRRGANKAFDYAAERAQEAAGHVYEAGREAAEREGLTLGGDKPIAERVGAVAKAAAGAAAGEARSEAERGRDAAGEAADGLRAKADEAADRTKSAADRAASGVHSATEEARSSAHAAADRPMAGSGASSAPSAGASRDAGTAIPGAGTVKPKTGTDDLASRAVSEKRDVGPGGTGPS
jgi:hypothetical protein